MTKDEALVKLLGLTDQGFGPDGLANVAFTLAALIEETGADLNKLLAAKEKIVERMTRQRIILQDQRSKEGIAAAKRQSEILAAFQDRKPEHRPEPQMAG